MYLTEYNRVGGSCIALLMGVIFKQIIGILCPNVDVPFNDFRFVSPTLLVPNLLLTLISKFRVLICPAGCVYTAHPRSSLTFVRHETVSRGFAVAKPG